MKNDVNRTLSRAEAMRMEYRLCTATQALGAVSLALVLGLKLLPALLAGLLVYQIVHSMTPELTRLGIVPSLGKAIALIIITVIMLAFITLGVMESIALLKDESGGLITLLQKMADVVENGRERLPQWMQAYLPGDVKDLQASMSEWLRRNASHLSSIGRNIGAGFVYVLIGMIIGGMIAVGVKGKTLKRTPFKRALIKRVKLLNGSFRRIVFSQIRISGINTLLTAVFLGVVLPAFDIHLPMLRIMLIVTFVAGLLPVVGNLISNTVIVLVSLGVSGNAAIAALLFLITIHKLEYFLNAHIIGTNIRARAWELLLAMLVMEAAFGLEGLVAAPIYYAYLKDELAARKLI